ncbi:hypothetical protein [Rodentibacter sp. Ppn85]|uniref:hypothetical protein n=1 Tax=Rodentibacter sp. Ppn85 TaxID=1908525 RepID=UPI0009856858|nr:hypothetical protein [Rodentibacter sp. Ppn85]OOF60358.1 hypothetical protein BKL51_11420 [Rodentibacter sp. Ppn85]
MKVPLLSKLKPGAQALNSVAVDFVYEVNKLNNTELQTKTEMIGSISGATTGGVWDKLADKMGVNPLNKVLINTIINNYTSDYSKGEYEKINKKDKETKK